MAEVTYVLCALTSLMCAVLLARGYLRTRTRMLAWSTACFIGLFINNVLLLLDLMFLPDVDLRFARAGSGLVSMLMLVVGLIWEGA